ncbi:metalloregulator ArsR/SmtB family transcription factor [Actinotalea subterranea]|uniref:metalloregulator ArsR/SmtB family transcription factor n=1 Tax=Actinotalea subterranea TaxID=2607497 RepID=UPI0011EBD9B3|nr:metalloregulator ArsR/SmtB family transcription factor [Actinotalea subterranea]
MTSTPAAPPRSVHAMATDSADRLAAMLRALADPLRLRMISVVAAEPSGEACVCDLASVADVSQPTVSHHLKVLRDAGLLVSDRRGTWVYYRVAPGAHRVVASLLESLGPAAVTLEAEPCDVGQPALLHTDTALTRAAERLAPDFPDLSQDAVLTVVRESYAVLLRTSRIPVHVPVLAERFARQRLEDLSRIRRRAARGEASTGEPAGARPRADGDVPQVLFVCVANAGRSQLAAALLQQYVGDAVVVRSAGSNPGGAVHATVRPLLDEIVPPDADPFPKPLTDDAVRAADVVITMGCGDACPIVPGVRYEDWAVGDPALSSPEGVRAIRDEIDRRVRLLAAELLPDTPPTAGTPTVGTPTVGTPTSTTPASAAPTSTTPTDPRPAGEMS